MAALLSEATKRPYDTTNLPITTVTFDEKNEDLIRFVVEGIRYEYDLKKDTLKSLGKPPAGETADTLPPAGQQNGQGRFGQGARNGDFHNYSPDKLAYVYAQDYNLYYVAVVKGKDQPPVQLTADGARYYSFGSRQEVEERRQQFQLQQQQQQQLQQRGGQRSGQRGGGGVGQNGNSQSSNGQFGDPNEKRVRANVTWSKDSKRFFVTREDERKVKDLYLVNSLAEPRPTLMTYRYSMPGEADVAQVELFAFDPDKHQLRKLNVDKFKDQTLLNIHWQDNTSDSLRFVRRDRLQRTLELCEEDLKLNSLKVLVTESVENASLEFQPVHYVKPGGDFIWWSERSGWGHYYLYSNDGKLKNAITSGPYRANSFSAVDGDKGWLYFEAVGYLPEENPYYRHLLRVRLDGSNLTMLDAGNADHASTLSEDKRYIVDVGSRVDMEPTAVLRSDTGKVLLTLEHTDLSRLREAGWQAPETFKVKAADGVTDIYGNLWKPFDFDPHKKYPIIAHVYPGPQTESVVSTFTGASGEAQLAQLGFIVIQIGNRGGNPMRSNAYQNYGYFNLRDYGLADKKAGIEQLAERYPWIDIDRVGIYGHSGGGFMTAAAMLLPPYNTFFKVGVASSGNHDNNVYNQNWSEQYHGLREVPVVARSSADDDEEPDPTALSPCDPTDLDSDFDFGWPDEPVAEEEDPQFITGSGTGSGKGSAAAGQKAQTRFEIHVPTNAELAPNLKGNLLLAHGDMDNNVHYAGTVRLMNALMRANKRFDFILIPGKPHGYGDLQGYFNQRMMEYFATYLLGDRYGTSAELSEHK
jgi:dipeptidyl aminopeptidase/acylaminoacyl peptidase